MIKLFFLMIFFLKGNYSLRADEVVADDQNFIQELNGIKNPFEDGLPKPVLISKPAPVPKPVKIVRVVPKPKPVPRVVIELPKLDLQGVIVSEDIHQAIINDKVVPLQGFIAGVQVIAVSKNGVGLLFKGKKFFLKVE